MTRVTLLLLSLGLQAGASWAAIDLLIETDRGRTEGMFSSKPVRQRAILMKPDIAGDTALLIFRGAPGYANIQTVADKMRNLPNFIRPNLPLFMRARIAVVIIDCPTDQQGAPGFYPTSCLDNYRSSAEHADDVRSVMAKLRNDHGFTRFFLLGHSAGTMSSRWLGKNLGTEIAGSIHSATMNNPGQRVWYTGRNFPYRDIAAPVLHVHHESDACEQTQYGIAKDYAGERLVTVRGGRPEGDPCATHYHSYVGREEVVCKAIIEWIVTGKIMPLVGE
jgi:hypothetical protein